MNWQEKKKEKFLLNRLSREGKTQDALNVIARGFAIESHEDHVEAIINAVQSGRCSTCQVLLNLTNLTYQSSSAEGSTRFNLHDVLGADLLSRAIFFDHKNVVHVLLASGADPAFKDVDGRSAIESAEHHDSHECAAVIRAWLARQEARKTLRMTVHDLPG